MMLVFAFVRFLVIPVLIVVSIATAMYNLHRRWGAAYRSPGCAADGGSQYRTVSTAHVVTDRSTCGTAYRSADHGTAIYGLAIRADQDEQNKDEKFIQDFHIASMWMNVWDALRMKVRTKVAEMEKNSS